MADDTRKGRASQASAPTAWQVVVTPGVERSVDDVREKLQVHRSTGRAEVRKHREEMRSAFEALSELKRLCDQLAAQREAESPSKRRLTSGSTASAQSTSSRKGWCNAGLIQARMQQKKLASMASGATASTAATPGTEATAGTASTAGTGATGAASEASGGTAGEDEAREFEEEARAYLRAELRRIRDEQKEVERNRAYIAAKKKQAERLEYLIDKETTRQQRKAARREKKALSLVDKHKSLVADVATVRNQLLEVRQRPRDAPPATPRQGARSPSPSPKEDATAKKAESEEEAAAEKAESEACQTKLQGIFAKALEDGALEEARAVLR